MEDTWLLLCFEFVPTRWAPPSAWCGAGALGSVLCTAGLWVCRCASPSLALLHFISFSIQFAFVLEVKISCHAAGLDRVGLQKADCIGELN